MSGPNMAEKMQSLLQYGTIHNDYLKIVTEDSGGQSKFCLYLTRD